MRCTSQISTVLVCFVIWAILSSPTSAQFTPDSTPAVSNTDSDAQAKDKKFAEKFWNYLLSNNYKHWSPAPGKTADHFASQTGASGMQSPHGNNVKVYINRTAASNPDSLPVGSVLIMENYREDKSLETISVMYRTPGFNPSANDWFWVNYNADGSITSTERTAGLGSIGVAGIQQASAAAPLPKKLVGRSLSCIECHRSGGGDLTFFNNQANSRSQIANSAIVPLVPPPAKPAEPVFKDKLEIRPAAIINEGPLQNFLIIPGLETVSEPLITEPVVTEPVTESVVTESFFASDS